MGLPPTQQPYVNETLFNIFQYTRKRILPPNLVVQNNQEVIFEFYINPVNNNWFCCECQAARGNFVNIYQRYHQVGHINFIYNPACPICDIPIGKFNNLAICGTCCTVYVSNYVNILNMVTHMIVILFCKTIFYYKPVFLKNIEKMNLELRN